MAPTHTRDKPAARARWLRLIPLTILVYIISFMDRTNIGFAFEGIEKSLHMQAAGAGLAGGIFFIGYLFLQIPGGHLAEHWSAKKFVGIMILVWGVMAVVSGFVQSYTQLLVVRFLLGVAEGGIWPAILVMIAHWFPAEERAQAFGVWIINIPIASIITSPLSGWILSFADWRTLFVIEGLFPFIIAAPLWWWLAADHPSQAHWVSKEERDYIEGALAEEHRNAPAASGYRDVFKSATVWKLVLVYFLIQIGFYGLNLWMPTLIQTLTQRGFTAVGLIAALPYVLAGFGLWFNGWLADKSGRYALHVFLAMLVAAISLVGSVLLGHGHIGFSIALICLAMGGALAYDGPFWAASSTTMPAAVLGGALGLINALGNLGGFVGPYVGGYLQDASGGSFISTAGFLAAMMLLAGVVMFSVKADRRTAPVGGND
ncbi:MFS transporter [Salinisphaera sp. SPP-AMP-43]|uniref:MFS transporter n=1 Tax=Salinisphaera sp. SPP-AMP-43 TaxID=3121288 RepID=UPI003C6DDB3A